MLAPRRYWPQSIAGVAYYNGLAAYGRGWHVKNCPHEPGRVERRYWRQGYAYARRLDRYRRRSLRRAGDYFAWPPGRRSTGGSP